jgi:hypothetical protein
MNYKLTCKSKTNKQFNCLHFTRWIHWNLNFMKALQYMIHNLNTYGQIPHWNNAYQEQLKAF